MKIWVTASNISAKQWNNWVSAALEWFQEVNIHSIDNYKIENSFIAIFTYDYFKSVGYRSTSLKNARGICHIDGLVNIAIGAHFNDGTFLYTSDGPHHCLDAISISKFQGEFSCVEVFPDKLTLATDFYATKPVYYALQASGFFATNDLRLLLINEAIHWSIDNEKCACFLSSSGSLGENEISTYETFFHNIKKVPLHHILIFSHGIISVTSYINYQNDLISANLGKNDSEYIKTFKHIINESVLNRVQNQSAVLMLSGGIDSSTILASTCDLGISDKIIALNMSFKDPDLYNSQDSEIAKKLIQDFGIRGGILWGDEILRIPNILLGSDPFNYIDGPNPSSNKLSQEVFAYYAINLGAKSIITGEQGDAILGEDNIILIYDSLIKSGLYKDVYELLKCMYLQYEASTFVKKLFNYCIFNLCSITRNKFYKNSYWTHTHSRLPSYFTERMLEFEKSLGRSKFQSLKYNFKLVGHMYVFDYFFPRSSYFDSMNNFIAHLHPFIDPQLLRFIFSNPTHYHCNYKEYQPGEHYASAKYLARQAYKGILPDYARLKTKKTSYAGMARKIMQNSKKDLITLLFDKEHLHISEIGLIDKTKFRKSIGVALIKIDDPNNNLGLGYQYLRTAIQMEIWLSCVKAPMATFRKLIKLRPPRQLIDIDWLGK